MDVIKDDKEWFIVNLTAGCSPFAHPHTAENCYRNVMKALARLGIAENMLLGVVQDTAKASINSFRDIPNVVAHPCAAHLTALINKWLLNGTCFSEEFALKVFFYKNKSKIYIYYIALFDIFFVLMLFIRVSQCQEVYQIL